MSGALPPSSAVKCAKLRPAIAPIDRPAAVLPCLNYEMSVDLIKQLNSQSRQLSSPKDAPPEPSQW
jgi:hypothetical protein